MYATQHKCDKCGKTLYLTRLNKRLFCKNCWEYKSESVVYPGKIKNLPQLDIRKALQIVRGDNKNSWIGSIA